VPSSNTFGRAFVLACAAAAAGAGDGHANGRPPATTNVKFQPGATETFYLPVTFGLLKSSDGGDSFRWVCEAAIGYSGVYDPDYAITPEGDIYVTTFEGLRVSRDGGCTFEGVGLDERMFVAEVEMGADGRIWAATSTGGGPNNIYVSQRDRGSTGRHCQQPTRGRAARTDRQHRPAG
jgi:hypothetical protein